jgi:hypothetical protein
MSLRSSVRAVFAAPHLRITRSGAGNLEDEERYTLRFLRGFPKDSFRITLVCAASNQNNRRSLLGAKGGKGKKNNQAGQAAAQGGLGGLGLGGIKQGQTGELPRDCTRAHRAQFLLKSCRSNDRSSIKNAIKTVP